MLSYDFMQNAFIVAIALGIILPFVGIIVMLRRMTFIADSLGHINMSGIAFAIFLTTYFSIAARFTILITIVWTILGAILIEYLRGKYQEYKEISIMIVYSLSITLTMIFLNLSLGYNASLFNVLFGNINAISNSQVNIILILIIVLIIYLILNYKKLILFSLEEEYVKLYGLNNNMLKYSTTILIAITISIAIKVIGVLLVSSLLIIPILTANNLANNLKETYIYALIITEFDLIFGIIIAYYINISTSAIIVLLSLVLYLISTKFKEK